MNEDELVNKIVRYFGTWFTIDPEEKSDCKKGRVDRYLTCKKTGAVFGVECKRPDNKRGEISGSIIIQCMKYSLMNFRGKRIPIFLIPAFSKLQYVTPKEKISHADGNHYYIDKHNPEDHTHHTFNGFLGSLNVGEIRRMTPSNFPAYYIFSFSNKVIFSTKDYGEGAVGLHEKNYEQLITKINNPYFETIFRLK